MIMRIGKLALGGLFSLLVGAGVASASPLIVDGLSQGTLNLTSTGSITGTTESGVDAIGGNRAASVFSVGGGTASATLSAGGPLTVTGSDPYLTLGYGEFYSGGGMVGGQAYDLNANLSSTNGLEFNFTNMSGNVIIGVLMETDYGGGSYGYLSNENPGDQIFFTSANGLYFISYSSLQNQGINLGKIDTINLTFQGVSGGFGVSGIAVPEPTMMLPVGLLGLGMMRKRKKN
jgi:hypothetical protein